MIYNFGNGAVTSDEQIEALALELYSGTAQPCKAMTEVFRHDGELFVQLNNINGPLETLRVVAVGYKIFLQKLDSEELEELATAV